METSTTPIGPKKSVQMQTFAQNKTKESTHFEPSAALLVQIENHCCELDQHLSEFKKRGLIISRHVAKISEAFDKADRSRSEFYSYMGSRFKVEKRTIQNYLAVGQSMALHDLDIDLSKLIALSALEQPAITETVKEIGRENLDAMTFQQVKEIVNGRKPRSPGPSPTPGENPMLSTKTLTSIKNRITALEHALAPYIGMANDLRAADTSNIDIIRHMLVLKTTLSKIVDTEPRPIPHEINRDQLNGDAGLEASPKDESDTQTVDTAELIEVELKNREPVRAVNLRKKSDGKNERPLQSPLTLAYNLDGINYIDIEYHQRRKCTHEILTQPDAVLYLAWLQNNPTEFKTFGDLTRDEQPPLFPKTDLL